MRIYLTLMVCSLVLLSSCRKNAIDDYPEFVGLWSDPNTLLQIDEDGMGEYSYQSSTSSGGFSSSVSKGAEGRIKIKNDQLMIGGMVLKMRFSIDAYPTEIIDGNGNLKSFMVLDGDTLNRF